MWRQKTLALSALCFLLWLGCSEKEKKKSLDNIPPPEEAAVSSCEIGRRGGRLVVATVEGPRTFNVALSNESSTSLVTSDIMFSPLVRFDNEEQKVIPGLARSWECSQDGQSWLFCLRKGLRWSDGVPLTVDDVLFTARMMCDREIRSARGDLLRIGGECFSFEKLDDYTLRVTLPRPYAPFLYVIGALYVLPKHKLEQRYVQGEFSSSYATDWPPSEIVSSGPFRLKEYRPGETLILERNPYYWEVDSEGTRLPYLDEVVFMIVPDQNAQLLKFQQGELNVLSEPRPEDFAVLKEDEGREGHRIVELGPSPDTNFLWFNLNPGHNTSSGKPFVLPHKLEWFQNLNFRRAVAHSIDREAIVRTIFFGKGSPIWGPTTRADKLWYNPSVRKYEYSLEKARELLRVEGFEDQDEDGWLDDRNGRKVEFTLLTNSESDLRISMANLIAQDLKALGIDVTVAAIDFGSLIRRIRETHEYETCLLGLSRGVPLDPSMGLNVWKSSGRTHFWFPEQPSPATQWEAEVDSLMDSQLEALQYEERKKIYDRVQEIICENVPLIYTASPDIFVVVDDRLGNVKPTVLRERVMWNIQCLYWKNR